MNCYIEGGIHGSFRQCIRHAKEIIIQPVILSYASIFKSVSSSFKSM